MSARNMDHMRNGVRVTRTALCRWERAPQGGLCATWRPGWRIASGADASGHNTKAAVRLTHNEHNVQAGSRRIDRWIAGSFIAALYLLVACAAVAIVVRV